jgi:hypothetical protein
MQKGKQNEKTKYQASSYHCSVCFTSWKTATVIGQELLKTTIPTLQSGFI